MASEPLQLWGARPCCTRVFGAQRDSVHRDTVVDRVARRRHRGDFRQEGLSTSVQYVLHLVIAGSTDKLPVREWVCLERLLHEAVEQQPPRP
jgi:hypothetical protein